VGLCREWNACFTEKNIMIILEFDISI
jgi:hypothetical protein